MLRGNVVRALVDAPLRAWNREEIGRLAASQGWRPEDDATPTLRYDPGDGNVTAMGRSEHEKQFGYGEYTAVYLSDRPDRDRYAEVFGAALATAEEVLGPPVLVGGTGARAQWRLADRLVDLSGGRRGGAHVALKVCPRDAADAEYNYYAELGDHYEPGLEWWVIPDITGPAREAFGGVTFHHRRPAADWATFDENARNLFGSMAVDVPLLSKYVQTIIWNVEHPSDDTRFVQGWYDADECHLEVWGDPEVTTTSKNGVPGLTLRPGDLESGNRIAELAVTAVRKWGLAGPGELSFRAWSNRKNAIVHEFGLGIRRQTS